MKYKVIKDYYMYGDNYPIYVVGQEFKFKSDGEGYLIMDNGEGGDHYFNLDDDFLEHFELVS